MKTLEELFGICPYATTQKILSGKWALMILHVLSRETIRFNELQRQLPDMTQTTLTRQLRSLEENGMIQRTVYPQIPPKVEYCLTDIGMEFIVVLDAIESWGTKYMETIDKEEPRQKQ